MAEARLQDARVAAGPILVAGPDLVEEDGGHGRQAHRAPRARGAVQVHQEDGRDDADGDDGVVVADRLGPRLEGRDLQDIDDLVDYNWTLTVIGQLLMQQGCAEVYPFVLAQL